MSRTRRNPRSNVFRKPKTYNERKQIASLMYDDEVPLRNRDKTKLKNLPTSWDDIVMSSYYEDYDFKHQWD